MLSLARRSGGIFELVLNIPNVIAVSIADPSRADHTNRAATNVCLEAACQRSFAAPKLAAPVRCLRDCRGNFAAGVVMQHQCPPTRYHAKSLTLSGGSVRWCAD